MNMKQARAMSGLTQGEMAKKLGISSATYLKYEHNPGQMKIKTAVEFSRLTGIPINFFLDDVSI